MDSETNPGRMCMDRKEARRGWLLHDPAFFEPREHQKIPTQDGCTTPIVCCTARISLIPQSIPSLPVISDTPPEPHWCLEIEHRPRHNRGHHAP